jgi:hypothetical protein
VTENFIYRAAILFRAHTPPQRVARQAMASTNYAAVTTVYNRDKESRAVRSLAVDPSFGTERRLNTLLMRCDYQSFLPTLHIFTQQKKQKLLCSSSLYFLNESVNLREIV